MPRVAGDARAVGVLDDDGAVRVAYRHHLVLTCVHHLQRQRHSYSSSCDTCAPLLTPPMIEWMTNRARSQHRLGKASESHRCPTRSPMKNRSNAHKSLHLFGEGVRRGANDEVARGWKPRPVDAPKTPLARRQRRQPLSGRHGRRHFHLLLNRYLHSRHRLCLVFLLF